MGLADADEGKLDLGIADYTKALALNPNYLRAYIGDKARAIVDFRKVLKINPSEQEAEEATNSLLHLGVNPPVRGLSVCKVPFIAYSAKPFRICKARIAIHEDEHVR